MGVLADLKKAHLDKADKRWEEAVLGARRYLTYDRARDHGMTGTEEEDAAVRALAKRMFTVRSHTLWEAMGGVEDGFRVKLNGYSHWLPYDSNVALMEFLRFFIGHELLDDGYPGVAYYRSTMMDTPRTSGSFARCRKEDPGAMPYFHINCEVMETEGFDPDPECLTVERALEILDEYEAQADRLDAGYKRRGIEHEKNPEDVARAALVEELIAMGPPPRW